MADDSKYLRRLLSNGAHRARSRRAEERAILAASPITYVDAVKGAARRIFGVRWIEPSAADDDVVLKAGTSHPRYTEVRRLDDECKVQIQWAERWLEKLGMVISVRGNRWVPRDALDAALREYSEAEIGSKRRRRIGTKAAAANFVKEYVAGEEAAGRVPTSAGAERALRAQNYAGGRELVRVEAAELGGIGLDVLIVARYLRLRQDIGNALGIVFAMIGALAALVGLARAFNVWLAKRKGSP